MSDYQSSHSGPTIDERVTLAATNQTDIAALKLRMSSAENSINNKADTSTVNTALATKQNTLVSGTNIKTIGGQNVLGPGDIPVNDENAVKFVAQTLTDAQKAQARTNIDAASTEEVSQLGQKVNGKEYVQMTAGSYIKLDVGLQFTVSLTPVSNAAFSYGIMDCLPGDKFVVNGEGTYAPRLWGFIDSSNKLLSVAAINAIGTDLLLTAPTNAVKIIINSKTNGQSYKVVTDSIPYIYAKETEVAELSDRVTEVENTAPQMVWECRNLWRGDTINGYLSSSHLTAGDTIAVTSDTDAYQIIKLAIDPDTDYTVSAESWFNYNVVAMTDENGVLLSNANTQRGVLVKTMAGHPSAAYLYVEYKYNGVSAVKLQIEKGASATEYDPGRWVVKPENISDDFQRSPIYGKIAAFFGDSICHGDGYGWATPIAKKYGVQSVNLGVSGSTLHDRLISGVLSSIRIKFEDYAQNNPADFYILSGGFNDSNSYFGAMSEGYPAAGNFNTENAVQAVEDICAYASENLAGKKIGFIIHYYPSVVDIWNFRADKIIEALEKWSIPYLDLRKCATFGLNNDERRAIYGVDLSEGIPNYDTTAGYQLDAKVVYDGAVYKANEPIPAPAGSWDASKWTLTGDSHGYDNMHCNNFAYDILARIIAEWMMTL